MKCKKGFTLIEVIVTIAMLCGAIAIFGVLLNVLRINKSGSFSAAANKIAQEEIDVIKNYPLDSLTTRTSSTFIGILDNNGSYGAILSPDAPSPPNILANNAVSSSPLGIIALPYNNLTDFTFESRIKTTDTSGKSGIIFRAKDLDNYYFLYLQNNQLVLEARTDGTTATLYSTSQTFLSDTWYKLKIVAAGADLSLYINDNFYSTINDDSMSLGVAALANYGNITYYDDVSLAYNATTENWNFDDISPASIPGAWQRFGINDLPGGTGSLTVSEPYGTAELKKIDVSVNWIERGENKSITISTLRAE